MTYEPSPLAIVVFLAFIGLVIGLSVHLGRRAKTAAGYYAAHGEIHWFVNGVAFAGDYLSAASFLGICGMIAFYGYDGFLYSIGYLAGWIVALFVIAEPMKRLGRFTFADALDARFHSRSIKLAAALSTLVVSLFYLIPQMVGAGTLVRPLLGLSHEAGVLVVGVVVILIVVTAGMVSTTYVQFIKGAMLVVFCGLLAIGILRRGFDVEPGDPVWNREASLLELASESSGWSLLPVEAGWIDKPYHRLQSDQTGVVAVWREMPIRLDALARCQTVTVRLDGTKVINGDPTGKSPLGPVGRVLALPDDRVGTGPLGPLSYLATFRGSSIESIGNETILEVDGSKTTVYYPKQVAGRDLLLPGSSPTFKGVRSPNLSDKLDFFSLMLALFCGTASLPHILIRYYTVKDEAAARSSTVVGIIAIAAFYVLTLYLGLGAMTSGVLDPTNSNMAAPLLARSFGELPFAVISAVAFTTVLGTVSGLILAASGAVAHDLVENVLRVPMTDHQKVRAGKITALVIGAAAMGLGILFQSLNVTFLVGWAFNVAASANLPSLVMLLFWPRTTKQGITAAVMVGMTTSLAWILLSAQAFQDVYKLPPEQSFVPFSQPALVTIPLGFLVLIVVSMLTQPKAPAETPDHAAGP